VELIGQPHLFKRRCRIGQVNALGAPLRHDYNTLEERGAVVERKYPWLLLIAKTKYCDYDWEEVAHEAISRFLVSHVSIVNERHASAILVLSLRQAFRDLFLNHKTESLEEMVETEFELPQSNENTEEAMVEKIYVDKAFSLLAPPMQAVLRLRLQGYTLQETSVTLGMPLSKVYALEKRAPKIMRQLISGRSLEAL
jgi:RNA polymerase sigma factor (sigma-70 family)